MRTESVSRSRASSRRAGAGLIAALALPGGLLVQAPADAATRCGDRALLLERLEQRHHETRQALGLSADGGVLELLVAPDGGWTILVTYPKRPTCVVAVGRSWQTLTLVGQQA